VNKSVALPLLMAFSFLFGDNNVQVRLENGQKAQGEFIGTYMNHVHILIGEKIIYYACDDIISITSASEGFSYGKGYDYDCSINTVTADILFPPEFDPMTGEMTQMLPDVFNPDIPKLAAKAEAGGVSVGGDFVIIDGVKYARVTPEKETAQAGSKAGMSVRAILPGQKSAIKSVFIRLFIAGSNAPTPGSIIALQSLESLKFLINIISSPRLSRDFVTE